jgi:hypothetical protein
MWSGIELSDTGKFVYGDDVMDTETNSTYVFQISP